jgi:hypothetical protein
MTAATTAPEPPRRGRGRPRTGRVRVNWTLPPDLRERIRVAAETATLDESALVEQILRASRRLR